MIKNLIFIYFKLPKSRCIIEDEFYFGNIILFIKNVNDISLAFCLTTSFFLLNDLRQYITFHYLKYLKHQYRYTIAQEVTTGNHYNLYF